MAALLAANSASKQVLSPADTASQSTGLPPMRRSGPKESIMSEPKEMFLISKVRIDSLLVIKLAKRTARMLTSNALA